MRNKLSSIEISEFTRYRQGYEDGYHGKEASIPHDETYMTGFREGSEDDQLGMPDRYNTLPTITTPVEPVRIEEIKA